MNSNKAVTATFTQVTYNLNTSVVGSGTVYTNGSVVYVDNLQPSWTAAGGGGVFSAYVGPPVYGYVSPGTTALYDGREAGIIKAGLAVDPDDGNYWDEGLFGFKPTVTIDALAAGTLTYDVENQEGTNPVWMTIEIDTGTVNNRSDNTVYQFVPTTNPAGWHTVDGAAGQWQKWDDGMGTVSEAPMSLSEVATNNSGLNVVRAYLRLGMGNSYAGNGSGTVAWVDKATIGGVTYDFVVSTGTTTYPQVCGTDVLVTAIPADGWTFSGWSGNLTGSTNPETITMNGDKSVTATFAVIPAPTPTPTPTAEPTPTPTAEPTPTPTAEPTPTPTAEPTPTPTAEPTPTPTAEPTPTPTAEPTATPTEEPTPTPTEEP
jgi:hypothetical protein